MWEGREQDTKRKPQESDNKPRHFSFHGVNAYPTKQSGVVLPGASTLVEVLARLVQPQQDAFGRDIRHAVGRHPSPASPSRPSTHDARVARTGRPFEVLAMSRYDEADTGIGLLCICDIVHAKPVQRRAYPTPLLCRSCL